MTSTNNASLLDIYGFCQSVDRRIVVDLTVIYNKSVYIRYLRPDSSNMNDLDLDDLARVGVDFDDL